MKKLAVILGALLLAFNVSASNNRFDTMVIFGDSLSDNGNLYKYFLHLLPVSPPYYEGHFSNGPLWIEQLYQSYFSDKNPDGFQDYAVGGAGAILSYKENLPYTLSVEVNNYLYWHTYGKKDTTLYVVWIGANNYLNGPSNIDSLTTSVVDAIGESVERLISKGGNKFLIANLPDIGRTPDAKENNRTTLLTDLTLAHNKKLAEKTEELKKKYPEVTFVYFDVYTLLNSLINHPGSYGLKNATEPCYMGGYRGLAKETMLNEQQVFAKLRQDNPKVSEAKWEMIENNPQLREAAHAGYMYQSLIKDNDKPLGCLGYVFWDRVHPTSTAHYLLARQVRTLIDEAGLKSIIPKH